MGRNTTIGGMVSAPVLIAGTCAGAFNEKQVRQLRQTAACRKCDLSGANLSGADLSKANLTDVNLYNAIWTDGSRCRQGSTGLCRK
jgi:uncharacterized protein YjbI with pentapeptide repeats